MVHHKEEDIVKINAVIFTGLIFIYLIFFEGMPTHCDTALMQEMLHSTWNVNGRVTFLG